MQKHLFTSESVTEGHPDKLCDQVSDAVLDAILAKDPTARVACEVAASKGLFEGRDRLLVRRGFQKTKDSCDYCRVGMGWNYTIFERLGDAA